MKTSTKSRRRPRMPTTVAPDGTALALRPDDAVQWAAQALLACTIAEDRRSLTVNVVPTRDGWSAVAIQGPGRDALPSGATAGDAAEKVLEDHAHEVIGHFSALDAALKASEKYVAKWRSQQLTRADKCACGEIGATA